MPKALLFTPADGRPTANTFWLEDHLANVPRIKAGLEANGFEVVWLHDPADVIADEFTAKALGVKAFGMIEAGDMLVPVTTGWNWPAHAGIIFTMLQDKIRSGALRVLNVCNMKEKAPGYVGQRANVLFFEIMDLPYECLTVIDQSDAGWSAFTQQIGQVLEGTCIIEAPYDNMTITDTHRETAKLALMWLRENVGFVKLINVASMTMIQGWPNVELFQSIGAVPLVVGSHEFEEEMAAIPQAKVDRAYAWLKGTGVQIMYECGGLCRREIDLALRMMLVKANWINKGCGGIGTQGQMEQIRIVATDISESLIMSSQCYGKDVQRPDIDVTETDCGALFTSLVMRAIMYIKTGKFLPVGFHDIRHYCLVEDILALLNSGALAFDFLVDSMDDWSDVKLVSQNREVYFLKGGAAVCGNMRPSKNNTLARFHAKSGKFKLLCTAMDIEATSWENRAKNYGDLDQWPFGKCKVPAPSNGGEISSTVPDMTPTLAATLKWIPNHGQHCGMNIVSEMVAFADLLELEHQCYAATT